MECAWDVLSRRTEIKTRLTRMMKTLTYTLAYVVLACAFLYTKKVDYTCMPYYSTGINDC